MIFFTLLCLSFGLGFFFGVYFAPTKKIVQGPEPSEETESFKAYSPQTDPVKLFYNIEYSYFDEVEPKESLKG